MASVSVFNLSPGTTLASGDLLVFCDISDTTQSANGSDLKITITNFFATVPVPIIVTSASANALAVGRLGSTTPAFTVDASTASQVAGLKVTGAATGGTVAIVATDSGANTNLTINAKGSGTIGIGSVSTGAVTITPALTLSAALTYGGVTLSNAVTGTGNMVLSASPTFTGTITAAIANFSGLVTGNLGVTVASGQTLTLTGATVAGTPTWSSAQAITISTATQASITTMANLTTVGALNAGSITNGFGSIDVGADSITGGAGSFTTGTFSGKVGVSHSTGSDNSATIYNLSNTGYGLELKGGTGAQYALLVADYAGNERFKVLGNGTSNFTSALTVGSGTAITAGGSLLGLMVSSTASFGVFVGSGAPSISAAKGSLYLRSDGTTTNDRAYIATDGAGTWTALTTAA